MVINILVVVRSSNEATNRLSAEILNCSVPQKDLIIISESPFSRAVVRTFKEGLAHGREWTLAVDADVLLTRHSVERLVSLANSLPQNFFRIEGMVLDRFFGFPRKGGAHLYRTAYLEKALEFLPQAADTLRPESRVVKEMVKAGYHSYQGNEVYGIHDYFQHHRDVFRKTFVYAQKHKHLIDYFKRYWTEMQQTDDEFKVALLGLEAGLRAPTHSLPDVQELYRLFEASTSDLVLKQQPVPEHLTAEAVAEMVRSHHIPEYGLRHARAAHAINRTDQKPSTNLFGRILKRVMRVMK